MKEKDFLQVQNIVVSVTLLVILVSFGYLITHAFTLTIANGKEYKELAASNSLGREPVFGERGVIVDRNGKPLVLNVKTYDIYVNTALIKRTDLEAQFSTYGEKVEELYKITYGGDKLFIHNAPNELIVTLKEKAIPGVTIRHSYVRDYPYKEAYAHLLGYTGVASEADMTRDGSIINNQIVGKNGLEYQYEKQLRGELRYDTYERDAFGIPVSSLTEGLPNSGKSLSLSIDKKQQEKMYTVLKESVDKNKAKGGSGIIIDIATGELIVMASYPSFDPNEFVSGISFKSYAKLTNSPQSPLLFRPIAAQEPPGSTFKTIVATAALEEGAITKDTTFYSPGVIKLAGGFPFQDYHKKVYGTLTVRDALMVSSNIFFCKTILSLGIEKFLPYAEAFGIGSSSGVDLPGEMDGRVPSPENKIALYKAGATWLDPVWYPEGDACNSAIGQGIALATPLQMANVAAAIANGGTVYKPHVVTKITDAQQRETRISPVALRKEIASEETLRTVRQGMRMSVSEARGVISSLRYVPVQVAAKTGTAEFGLKDKNGYSTAHAWVIGFYPYNEPKYAFAVLVEGGGTSSVASYVMRDFLNAIY
jgi:penicillin-binding protein 2